MKLLLCLSLFSILYLPHSLALKITVPNDSASTTWLINKPAPKISITTTQGKTYHLGKAGNEILVINFWFIACGPCRHELPLLNELFEVYKNRDDIHFVAISNIDNKSALEYVKKRMNMKYELVTQAQSAANAYKVLVYPTNLIVDKNGAIVFAEDGFHPDIKERMQKVIDGLIEA